MPPSTPRHDNAFDALRLLGAVLVIIGHAYVLMARPAEAPELLGIPVHVLGVSIFFSISGYLIWGSWHRNRSLVDYFSARILRILPALVVAVILTAFVVGPIVSTLSASAYFADPGAYAYLRNIVLFLPDYHLPGVFQILPYPDVVNGSLWTLRVEFGCYILVPLVGFLPRVARAPVIGVLTLCAALLGSTGQAVEFGGSNLSAAAAMCAFFGVGALARMLRETGLQLFRPWAAVFAGGLWWLAYAVSPQAGTAASWLALPYIVLTIGTWPLPVVRRAARYGDLSYGMYLWAFPLQQAAIQYLGWESVWANILLVALAAALLALPSWHLVEKTALAQRYRPGRWLSSLGARSPRPL